MSLLLDLLNVARSPTTDGTPPIDYINGSGNRGFWSSSDTAPSTRDLELTTQESTLWSVLDLLASTTSSVKWHWERPFKNPSIERAPIIVTAEQSLPVKLWQRPNKFMSGQHLRYLAQFHYDAVGSGYIVVDFVGKVPLSMWPVRPDRMTPIPGRDNSEFIIGYEYRGPGGETVPLETRQVLKIQRPHPFDVYQGMGMVRPLRTALATSQMSQMYTANYFQNDATPGGIIEVPEGLQPTEFKKMVSDWNEQHRGYSRAHRVAILEFGKWVDRNTSMKDMQFTELRALTRDQILEAVRVHKNMMGISEDVNRANAEAGTAVFASNNTVPRLNEWEALANGAYIEMFNPPGEKISNTPIACYENPVPEDETADNAERDSRTKGVATLVNAGFDPVESLVAMGLPAIKHTGRVTTGGGTNEPAPSEPA